jgi:GNAT superfamily N-acetyltransferase
MLKKIATQPFVIKNKNYQLNHWHCQQFDTHMYNLTNPFKEVVGCVYIQTTGLIHDLWVRPADRGCGLGSFLVNVAKSKGGNQLTVGNGEQWGLSHEQLKDFYKGKGFKQDQQFTNKMRLK